MPYQSGNRLPGESASKLGHLDVIKSDLVNQIIGQFDNQINQNETELYKALPWESLPLDALPLRTIFAVDGSLQPVRSETFPHRELMFVKTALLRLDQRAISKIDQAAPHPLALRDLMRDAALYHATVIPLRNMSVPGMTNYDVVRKTIFDSMRDQSLNAEPFETLKWLAYEKWTGAKNNSPSFECPHCADDRVIELPYDADDGTCCYCGGHVYLSDMLGFHLEMAEDAASDSVASAYMLIHETLLLFSGIRYFWEHDKKELQDCLFIKDGPLTLRSQYSKLVIPIRRFFAYALQKGIQVHVFGQEKTGAFVDHLSLIARFAPPTSYLLPSNKYIRKEVQRAPDRSEPYGSRTNYGSKVFVKTNENHYMVLSIPTNTSEYKEAESLSDLIGAGRIFSTLPKLISYRHEGALQPIVLANGIASLSTYPSAKILKIFAKIG